MKNRSNILSGCLLVYLFFLGSGRISAQDMTIRNVLVSIPEGISMRVDHSLTNTGTLVNKGRLLVGRNWINTGIYRDDISGMLSLNGNIKQFIVDSRGQIGSLMMSGGEKELVTDLFISKRLVMSDTKLLVSEGYGLRLDEKTIFEYGERDWVIGELYMTGNDLTFPLGTTDRFLPVRIQLPDDQRLELGLSAQSGKIGPALESTLAEVADFHWILKYPEEFQGAFAEIGFENAAFLQAIELARVAESIGPTDSVRDAGSGNITGSLASGTVVSSGLINGPYLTLARRFADNEKPLIHVLNLVTPDNDGYNDYLMIENIDAYPDNKVSIFDRWGTKLYEASGYNNGNIRFEGVANKSLSRGQVEKGTYFYLISSEGEKLDMGFFELTR